MGASKASTQWLLGAAIVLAVGACGIVVWLAITGDGSKPEIRDDKSDSSPLQATIAETEALADDSSPEKVSRETIPTEGLFISGRVINKVTREPVTTYWLSIGRKPYPEEQTSKYFLRVARETIQNEDGRFVYKLDRESTCYVTVRSSRYPPMSLDNIKISPEEGSEEILIELDPGVQVSGRVVEDASDKPIAEAVVLPEGYLGSLLSRPSEYKEFVIHSMTDESGRFRLNGLEQKKYKISALHPDFAQGWTEAVVGEVDDIEIRLKPGFCIFGMVLNDAGEPCAGAVVDMFRGINAPLRVQVYTNANGSYRIPPILPGIARLFARPPPGESEESFGLAEDKKSVTIVDRDVEVNFGPLPEHVEWRGTFYGHDGKPQPKGQIKLESTKGDASDMAIRFSHDRTEYCDDTGQFVIRRLLPGKYKLSLMLSDGTRIRKWKHLTFDTPGLHEEDIRLPLIKGLGEIKGIVVDRHTGAPLLLQDYYIRAHWYKSSYADSRQGYLDEQGCFDITLLPSGYYGLHVWAKGYPSKSVRNIWVPVGGSSDEVRIELDAGGELRIRLSQFTEEVGKEFRVVRYLNRPGTSTSWSSDGRIRKDGTWKGEFQHEPGEWLVRLSFEGNQSVERSCTVHGGQTTELYIVPSDVSSSDVTVAVSGTLTRANGTPMPGAHLHFNYSEGVPNWRELELGRDVVTDSEGRFLLEGAYSGYWVATLMDESRYCPRLSKFRIPQEAQKPVELTLVLPDGTVSGILYNSKAGQPIAESSSKWFVIFRPLDGRIAGTGYGIWRTGSTFDLFGFPEGRYYFDLQVKGYADYESEVFHHPGTGNVDLGMIQLQPLE